MLKEKIKKFFTGVSLQKEYPCVDYHAFGDEVRVILNNRGNKTDITDDHLFLGYKPLIAGIVFDSDIAGDVTISFVHRNSSKLAALRLKKFTTIPLGDRFLILFTGEHADVWFLPLQKRFVNNVIRKLRKPVPGNVEMEGNEYQQVQAMYAVPRKISIISLGSEGLYNMFPTDLHGNAGKGYYVDSLRKAGKACSQVLALKKIVKTDVELSARNEAFAMGKNHMQEPADVNAFVVEGFSSLHHLPLPGGAVAYKEMELYHNVEIGIHRVLIFKVQHEEVLHADKPVLACTNSHYMQWRIDHSLPVSYF